MREMQRALSRINKESLLWHNARQKPLTWRCRMNIENAAMWIDGYTAGLRDGLGMDRKGRPPQCPITGADCEYLRTECSCPDRARCDNKCVFDREEAIRGGDRHRPGAQDHDESAKAQRNALVDSMAASIWHAGSIPATSTKEEL